MNNTEALRLALDALENVAVDLAIAQQNDLAQTLGGYRPHKHEAAKREREQIEAAAAACRAALAQPAASGEPAGLSLSQEPKYTVTAGFIVNRSSGEAIPADEPVFIFRARDVHAREAIEAYACVLEPGEHRDAVVERVADFARFAAQHPGRMRVPDTARAAPQPAPALEVTTGGIPAPMTEADEARLKVALGGVFGWAAQPAPARVPPDVMRHALKVIDKHSVATIRTNSKDRGDWAEDMAYVGKVAREALAAAPTPQQEPKP